VRLYDMGRKESEIVGIITEKILPVLSLFSWHLKTISREVVGSPGPWEVA
jgi:hypothetical protein